MGKRHGVLGEVCLSLSLLLAACGPANGTVRPAESNPGTAPAAPATQPPAEAVQAPAIQTPEFPSIVLPAAGAIIDIHSMDSYTMTARHHQSGINSDENIGPLGAFDITSQDTIEYIRVPEKYHVSETAGFDYGDGTRHSSNRDSYLIGDRRFERASGAGPVYWFLWLPSIPPNRLRIKSFAAQSSFSRDLNWLRGAHLAGQEDYHGIPSNHFTFDETDLDSQALQASGIKLDQAQGNFYLALDGNYPIHYDVKMTGDHILGDDYYNISTYEIVKDLVSINQVNGIVLPPDVPQFDLDNRIDLPLPPGAVLEHIYLTPDKTFYYYDTDMGSVEEVVAFYEALEPGSGWSFYDYSSIYHDLYITNGNNTLEIHIEMKNGRAQINPIIDRTP